MKGAGGTSGGIGQFFIGLIMMTGGFYLLLNAISVTSHFALSSRLYGFSGFGGHFAITSGMVMIPFMLGIGMVFYGVGGFCEAFYGTFGWNPVVFRLWYLFGAILVAAWLGQGTVFLLAKKNWANITMALLVLGSMSMSS